MKQRTGETVGPAIVAGVATLVAAPAWWSEAGAVVICEVAGITQTRAHMLALSGPLSLLSALTVFVVVERYMRGVE